MIPFLENGWRVMREIISRFPFVASGIIWAFAVSISSAETMEYRHNAPESPLDQRYLYHWKILETALEKTAAKYGPYKLESGEFMTEQRQAFELKNATGLLTVTY